MPCFTLKCDLLLGVKCIEKCHLFDGIFPSSTANQLLLLPIVRQIAPCAWHFFPCAWHFFAIACMPSFASRDPALITLNVVTFTTFTPLHLPTYPHSLEVRPFPTTIAAKPETIDLNRQQSFPPNPAKSRQLRFPREKMPCAGEAKLPIAKKCHAQGKSPNLSALPSNCMFLRK